MTDAPEQPKNAPETSEGATEHAPQRHTTPAALWVLAVLGGFLALAALWYAVFGSPQRIGPDLGLPDAASLLASSEPTATSASAPISANDVRAVLSAIDYAESSDSSSTEYQHAFTRMLDTVDLLTFARNTLREQSSVRYTDLGAQTSRLVTGAEKNTLVDNAAAEWVRMRTTTATPDAAPLNETFGVRMFPPMPTTRNQKDSLFEVIGQGLHPLVIMFGAQDTDDEWAWKVESVSVTGTSTAEVTYTAFVKPNQGWSFVDPNKRYVKQLVFSPTPDGTWKLAGFTNWAQVEREFRANTTDPSRVGRDEWWGAF